MLAPHLALRLFRYVKYTGPRSFLQQMKLFDSINGTEDVAIHTEPADITISPAGLLG